MMDRGFEFHEYWLDSVANGLLPQSGGHTGVAESNKPADTPILKTLQDCKPALRWLNNEGPTQELPKEFAEPIKRLETLGIVYRRNNKTFSLRLHRLQKVLAHESQKLSKSYKIEDLLYS